MDIVSELKKQLRKQRENPLMPHRALVFWYDPNGRDRDLTAVEEMLKEENIKLWQLNEKNVFSTKIRLEIEDPENSYLIYAPFSKPADEENYLLDILLYAGDYGEFQADEIAITMKELHIDHLAVRSFIEEYWAFFKEKRRKDKFRNLLPAAPAEEDVTKAILAVLSGASALQSRDIIRAVLEKGMNESENDAILRIDKYLDRELFYILAAEYLGITEKSNINLQSIFYTIVYNHFISDIDFEIPASFSHHYPSVLPNTCRVFLDDWFRTGENCRRNEVLQQIETEWAVSDLLKNYSYTLYERSGTFPVTDHLLIDIFNEQVISGTVDLMEWKGIFAARKQTYWYHNNLFQSKYELLDKSLDLLELQEQFRLTEEPADEKEWITSYTSFFYKIDQSYRKFISAYLKTNESYFENLAEKLTNWYENVYLDAVGKHTDSVLDNRLAERWPIFEALKQKSFYSTMIKPHVEGSNERIFVIVTDALRYEAGEELKRNLERNLNSVVTLTPMQASLPSYTQLGMASLLPGKITAVRDDGTVEVNNLSSRGLQNREKILRHSEVDSRAMQLTNFLSMKTDEGTKILKGQRVIYLYHDRIDATGDSGKSEFYTFEAVEQAISDLMQAVKKLTGTYGASRIYITSDHGFIYQHSNVESHQKSLAVLGEITDSNRRFVIGKNLELPEGAKKVSLEYLGLDLEAAVAKGINRFKGSGGLRFVHGGAMPQESIVPVIEYRQVRGKARKREEERVDVKVALRNKTITNYRFKVSFFQEEKVTNNKLSRTLRTAFYKGDERISNEMILTFDSTGGVSERQQEVTFSFMENNYPSGERCMLRMEDVSGAVTELYNEEEFELRLSHIK
jgi:uncharacterized protein (TIGR02687 family)